MCIEVGRRRRQRLQIGKLFQQIAVGGFVFTQTLIDAGKLAIANICCRFRFVAALDNRLLFLFELRDGSVLLFRVLQTLRLDLFDPLLQLRNSRRNFALFVFQLFQRDNFVADFRKVDRLRATLAAKTDFTFLQKPLLMAQGHARFLTANLETNLAQPGANETHRIRLPEL